MRTWRSCLAFGLALLVLPVASTAQLGGTAGAFLRMGFGARGVGMGNALTAVPEGDVIGYYNPALLSFASHRHASATAGILSLDRSLNFLGFSQPLPPAAGLFVGIASAGVADIDGRNSDGRPTGPLSTSENAVFLGFSNRFRGTLALGVNIKLLHHRLYTGVVSTKFGIDIGAALPIGERFFAGATVRDIGSKYKWDTAELYGRSGQTTEDFFPRIYTAGLSYRIGDSAGVVSCEYQASSRGTSHIRMGAELHVRTAVTIRGGIDRIDLREKGTGVRPSGGFTVRHPLEGWIPAVTYALVIEPFSPAPLHLISLSAEF